ncbi:hypothetical protein GGI07_004092 [Coemansia sp. Benny D115]|nr:hypothetical protein GGI07_004092 [Coemansia sp. Benny D115]
MEDHINVAIRVRPLNQREVRSTGAPGSVQQLPWSIQQHTITQKTYTDTRVVTGNSFTYDKVFDQKDSTQKVYDDIVKEIITSSMGGFNGTIFAYGQTSSGKTHTMYGGGSEQGIIKLAVKNMFSIVENDTRREYLIRVSFLEIYNEILRDLLEPSKTNLKIHENAKREIFVGDLSEHIVFNADQVEEILQKGDNNRHIAGTNMNERSSRSHTIFRIVIESREKAEPGDAPADGPVNAAGSECDAQQHKRQQRLSTGSAGDSTEFTGAVMVSCLNLVDLAGSERVGQTGAEGQRLKEGAHINRSLLSLGTVIARLSEDGGDRGHIPYRDSKITRILQPSLGGNAKTLIICTITPSPDYVDETLSTLKFASRAKTIKNKPEVNEELRGDALLRRLKRASELEKEVAQMKEIERKKLKIEADNESLLRQLFKSQKERERLQRELELQQSNVFLPRSTDGKDAADTASAVRRQTWFPGLQRPFGEPPAHPSLDAEPSSTPKPSSALSSPAHVAQTVTSMDVDGPDGQQMHSDEKHVFAGVSLEDHQTALERISDLELKNDALQQQHAELAKGGKEMEDVIQRYMREYNLLLSTLNQLASAEAIPPSPAKADSASLSQPQSPRELVQIRRKLRALMTTIDASQRMCHKFRSQRPEAEFLEMELQAVRETLLQKEEELVEVLRESDEMFVKSRQTESDLAAAETVCAELQSELASARDAQSAAAAAHEQLLAQLERERQESADRLRAETDELKAMADEQTKVAEALSVQFNEREASLLLELKAARADIQRHESNAEGLETRLAATTAEAAALASECQSLVSARSQAEESQKEAERLAIVASELREQVSALTIKASELEAQTASQQSLLDNKTAEAGMLGEQVEKLTASLKALEVKAAESEKSYYEHIESYESMLREKCDAHAEEISELQETYSKEDSALREAHEAEISAIREVYEKEVFLLKAQSVDADVCADKLQKEISDLSTRLSASEASAAQLSTELAQATEKANAVPQLIAEAATLKEDLASLQAAREQLSADLDQKIQELGAMADERAMICTQIEDLESQNANVWERVSELTVSNNDLSTGLSRAENDLAERSARIDDLVSALADAEAQRDQLQLNIDKHDTASTQALREANARVEELETTVNQQKAEYAAAQAKWDQQLSEKSDQLTDAENRLQSTTSDYEQQLKDLRARESESAEAAKQLKSSLEAVQAQLNGLREHMSEADQSKGAVLELNAELSQQLEAKSQFLHELEMQKAALQSELDASNSQLVDLRAEIAKEHAAWESQHSDVLAQVSGLQSDLALAQEQMSQAGESYQTSLKKLESQLEESKSSIANLERALEESMCAESDAQALLTTRASEHDARVADLCKRIDELEQQIEVHKEDACLSARNSDQLRQSLEARISDLTDSYDKLAQSLESAEASRGELLAELAAQKALADRLSLSTNESTKHVAEIQEQHEAAVAELRSQMEQLMSERELSAQQSADSQAQLASFALELKELQAVKLGLDEKCASLEAHRDSLTLDLTALKEQHQSKIDEFSAAALQLGQRSQEVADLQSRLDRAQGELSEHEQLIAALQADIRRVTAASAASKDLAHAEHDAADKEIASLKDQISLHLSENAQLQEQLEELISVRDYESARAADLQTALQVSKEAEAASAVHVSELEREMANLAELLSLAKSKADSADTLLAESEQAAAARSEALEKDVARLTETISAKSHEASELLAQLEDAQKQAASLTAAQQELVAERDGLRADHEALVERARESQAQLEQSISEMRVELSSKSIAIQELEAALESANASVTASQTRAQEETQAAVESLEQKIVSLEQELAEARSIADNGPRVAALCDERDRALEGIETLKTMMTELAQVKNDEIADLEERLSRHEALLEASVREVLEKDEALGVAEKLASTHLERATRAEAQLEKAAADSKRSANALARERDDIQAKLESVQLSAASIQKQHFESESELALLRQEIELHQKARADLQASLDRVAGELDRAEMQTKQAVQKASDEASDTVRAHLASLVEELMRLPCCAAVAPSVSESGSAATGNGDLLGMARALISAAAEYVSAQANVSTKAADDSSAGELQSDVDRLRTLCDKLEKKNVKLRDAYTCDVTKLHAEEEKQRERADLLAAELGESTKKIEDLKQQLARLDDELERQRVQKAELESTAAELAAKVSAAQTGRATDVSVTPVKSHTPAYAQTPENGHRSGSAGATAIVPPGSNSKGAMARLASQRTPLKSDANKRAHVAAKAETMLSPITSSMLNARLASSTTGQEDGVQQISRYPTRKRAAMADENAAASPEPAASKASESMRARSTYGDRRRNRRNQPATRTDGLDEQAAEQCAQQ